MIIRINQKITDNVFGAVWLAALILTYERVAIKKQDIDVILKQSEIQAMAQKICSKSVQSARISQWCNGDHPDSRYNYLKAIGRERRLTKIGDFNQSREYPRNLIGLDKEIFVVEETNKSIVFEELLNWFIKDYSKSKYSIEQSGIASDSDLTILQEKSIEPVKRCTIRNEDIGQENLKGSEELHEDQIKTILIKYLEENGWKTQFAMGKVHGIDIDAYSGQNRWIIEVKGCGSGNAMRVNYFLAILGETLQRMNDPNAKYSIALPNIQQYKNLWARLPRLAKDRTGITVLFVSDKEDIEENI